MEPFDLVESWLNNVAMSHSNSEWTRLRYKVYLKQFCDFIGKTPEQIVNDYEDSTNPTERTLMKQYARSIQAYTSELSTRELSPCTIRARLAAVKSFFKYNNLPTGYAPIPRMRVIYHNRDITHEEVKLILDASRPRERAYFAIMAQSGLRPETICNLKYKNLKEDLAKGTIPNKIDIPEEIAKGKYHSYFTFIGEEAVRYLKSYLYLRRNIADEDYLFVKEGSNERTDPKSLSNIFARTILKLQAKGLMEVEQKQKTKPRNIRLYNLRKFFRKHAHQAGFELVQFWMGHTVHAGLDEHYRPTDVEFHRKEYAEKAMPFLRIESATPTETEKTIDELKKQLAVRDKEIEDMKRAIAKLQPIADFLDRIKEEEAEASDYEKNASRLEELFSKKGRSIIRERVRIERRKS